MALRRPTAATVPSSRTAHLICGSVTGCCANRIFPSPRRSLLLVPPPPGSLHPGGDCRGGGRRTSSVSLRWHGRSGARALNYRRPKSPSSGCFEVHGPMTGEALQAKAAAALPDISPFGCRGGAHDTARCRAARRRSGRADPAGRRRTMAGAGLSTWPRPSHRTTQKLTLAGSSSSLPDQLGLFEPLSAIMLLNVDDAELMALPCALGSERVHRR